MIVVTAASVILPEGANPILISLLDFALVGGPGDEIFCPTPSPGAGNCLPGACFTDEYAFDPSGNLSDEGESPELDWQRIEPGRSNSQLLLMGLEPNLANHL
jgi:hypothetical protein